MAAAANDMLQKVGVAGTLTSLAAPGHSISGTTITVGSTTNWPTDTGVTFAIRQVDSSGVLVAETYTEWRGVVSGSTLTGMVLAYGNDQVYPAGSTTQVYLPVSAYSHNRMIDALTAEHSQLDGTHTDITADTITATTGTFDSVVVSGTATSQGWTPLGDVPDTVTANGNRNYDLVFNGVDHTSTLSPGMKLQLTRTVAAPSQCTSLNGTTQYYNRTSTINGMTFTDDFTVSAWIKVSSYANAKIVSRYNGTSGWYLAMISTGQIALYGHNASSANHSEVTSYASVPLNKWVHVTAQLDMSTFTATTTTSYVMFDGIDIAASVNRTGTNPTALIQAGNLEVGSQNGGLEPFPGKIAQVAIYSAKVPQATIKNSMDRTLTGSETSLVSAYSFNGASGINDLNANANNLTAQGSAVATNADSPFANAVTAGLLEYAEVNSVTFSTNTTVNVRVPDTCQIPTSGGVSAVSYSTQSNPYGLPYFSKLLGVAKAPSTQSVGTGYNQINGVSVPIVIPPNGSIVVFATLASNSGSAIGVNSVIWAGAVSSGLSIGYSDIYMATTGTTNQQATIGYYKNTSPTTHLSVTINLSGAASGSTFTASNGSLIVELV